MTDLLRAIAGANGGYFTAAQARDCGYDQRDLQRAMRTGVARRIRHGTYAFADTWDPLTSEARHVVTLKSVVAARDGAVVASGVSACALRGLSLWDLDLQNVHITRLDGGAGRREAGVVHHHGRVRDEEIEIVDGVPCVHIDRAMCETGALASLEAGIALYDSGLRLGVVTEESLGRCAASMKRVRDTRRVRWGVLFADGRSGSVGESRNRFLFYRFAIPAPDLQYKVRGHDGRIVGYTDFAWQLYCHLGEFDGLMKYQRDLNGNQDPAQVVVDEKLREDAIREAERKGMTRTIWRELAPRAAADTAARTKAEMERSRTLYAKGRVHIPL